MIRDVLAVLKIKQSKIYINDEIKKRFGLEEDMKVAFCINESMELVLAKSTEINRNKDLSSLY